MRVSVSPLRSQWRDPERSQVIRLLAVKLRQWDAARRFAIEGGAHQRHRVSIRVDTAERQFGGGGHLLVVKLRHK